MRGRTKNALTILTAPKQHVKEQIGRGAGIMCGGANTSCTGTRSEHSYRMRLAKQGQKRREPSPRRDVSAAARLAPLTTSWPRSEHDHAAHGHQRLQEHVSAKGIGHRTDDCRRGVAGHPDRPEEVDDVGEV